MATHKKKKSKHTKRKCRKCRCKPCLCKKQIHCYKITCTKRKKKKTKKSQKGGRSRNKQNWEKNEGYFGPIMKKNGKLVRDEICRYCWPSDYAKGARKFCKIHKKIWDSKTNSCRKKVKSKKR